MVSRRRALGLFAGGAAGVIAGSALSSPPRPAVLPRRRPQREAARTHDLVLRAAERKVRLLGPDGPETTVWSYTDELFPVLRVRQGDRMAVTLKNELTQHTSVHWHGLRLPNAMDGVQYVTQPPVEPGQSFRYDFTLADTGTFFFHPHCNESGQIGHGLAGILVVEGDEVRVPDDEVVLAIKDWRLNPDGTWLDFVTPQGAARAGTFGTVRQVNGRSGYSRSFAPGSEIRVRLLNLDSTRVVEVGVEGGEAALVAVDGHPIPPVALDSSGIETWRMGPAMRVDLLVRIPPAESALRIVDYFSAEPWEIARFAATGEPLSRQRRSFEPAILSAADIPAPDLKSAERLSFAFSAASSSVASFGEGLDPADPLTKVLMDSLCVRDGSYWAINKASWPSDGHFAVPPPLAVLKAGRSYVFELMNATPHPHPIHLHGHVFRVLSSSRTRLPQVHADTVLLSPKERVEIAFVAAPGAWMFHCHILEHLETGMMGWIRVAA
jgi:FtsP/CotA-like multicopper oxidase with cupredoxin domain